MRSEQRLADADAFLVPDPVWALNIGSIAALSEWRVIRSNPAVALGRSSTQPFASKCGRSWSLLLRGKRTARL
jgi:hypothetical protein